LKGFNMAEMECSECGADLFDGQKFCAGCGIEMEWSAKPTYQEIVSLNDETKLLSKSDNFMANVLVLVMGAVVVVVVAFIYNFLTGTFSGFNNGNQQDECFKKEMLKVGAYADPKGWAIQSRLYCAALNP
jgi:uncharacterized membrane protein YvbJ